MSPLSREKKKNVDRGIGESGKKLLRKGSAGRGQPNWVGLELRPVQTETKSTKGVFRHLVYKGKKSGCCRDSIAENRSGPDTPSKRVPGEKWGQKNLQDRGSPTQPSLPPKCDPSKTKWGQVVLILKKPLLGEGGPSLPKEEKRDVGSPIGGGGGFKLLGFEGRLETAEVRSQQGSGGRKGRCQKLSKKELNRA